MWHLKPGSYTLDVDDDDAPQDCNANGHTEESSADTHVPVSSRVTVLDSDSEDSALGEASIRNPLTPRLRPQDPDFGFSESLLLRPIEVMAARMLQRDQHPTKEEILELFLMMPASGLRRVSEGSGIRYLVSGASPRSNADILSHCTNNPYFTLIVNRFIYSIAPMHKYTTYVIRQGCSGVVHRDVRNRPFRSMIVNLGIGGEGDGLWVHDRMGSVFKTFGSQVLPGNVRPLDAPCYLDARKYLHAGHVADKARAQARVVLIAFSTLNLVRLGPYPRSRLLGLGFPLPDPRDPASQSDMNDFGAQKRDETAQHKRSPQAPPIRPKAGCY